MSEAKVVVCPQCGKKYKLAAAFDAASFQCKACAATVWVEEKPAVSSRRTKSGRGRKAGRASGRKAKGGRPAPAPSRARRQRDEDPEDGGERRPRYQRQKSKSGLIVGVVAAAVMAGLGIAFMMNKDKKDEGSSMASRDLLAKILICGA